MIRSGYFVHGQKLPTLTEMRSIFNVSLKVAAQAYDDLNKKGYIYSKRGKGYFVSFYERLQVQLENIHQLEAELVYEKEMNREVLLFEVVDADDYIASKLSLNQHQKCCHIKQTYGKNQRNILLQELYLPIHFFSELLSIYDEYKTTPSLIMNGYRYNIDQFTNHFYSSQASCEQEIFLKLQKDDPLWHIETQYISDDNQPLVFMNQYLSGQFVNMAVMIDVG